MNYYQGSYIFYSFQMATAVHNYYQILNHNIIVMHEKPVRGIYSRRRNEDKFSWTKLP